jgi:hypothetical protein
VGKLREEDTVVSEFGRSDGGEDTKQIGIEISGKVSEGGFRFRSCHKEICTEVQSSEKS